MYELESMMRAMVKKTNEPSDEEWASAEQLLAEATAGLPDVRV